MEIKTTLCFKGNKQTTCKPFGERMGKGKGIGRMEDLESVSFYEILKICSLNGGNGCVYLLGGFCRLVSCGGESHSG